MNAPYASIDCNKYISAFQMYQKFKENNKKVFVLFF